MQKLGVADRDFAAADAAGDAFAGDRGEIGHRIEVEPAFSCPCHDGGGERMLARPFEERPLKRDEI